MKKKVNDRRKLEMLLLNGVVVDLFNIKQSILKNIMGHSKMKWSLLMQA